MTPEPATGKSPTQHQHESCNSILQRNQEGGKYFFTTIKN
jgi:hypothetical protein